METKTKLMIAGLVLATIGGVWYFGFRKPKEEEGGEVNMDSGNMETENTSTGSTKPSSSVRTLAFQKWYNSRGYTPKLTEDGAWGSKTSSAYDKYGASWEATLKTNTTTTTTTTTQNTPKKTWKLYSKLIGAPIWNKVNDITPYRLAGNGEYIGITNGAIVKSYVGNEFYKVDTGKGDFKYVAKANVTWKAN